MGTATVNIAFQTELLKDIDTIAKSEARSRSELLKEAVEALYRSQAQMGNYFFLRAENSTEERVEG